MDGDFAPIKIILGRLWSIEEVKRGKRNKKKHEKKFQKEASKSSHYAIILLPTALNAQRVVKL